MYPWAFFVQVCYVLHIISNSKIYFGLLLLILIILSYIETRYDHLRPFYRNLKMIIFSSKSMLSLQKSNFWCLDWQIKMIEESRNKNLLRNTFDLLLLIFLNVFFNLLIKLKQIILTFFPIFAKKAWIFELKMIIFQISIKWPEMVVYGCYIAQNDRN